MFSSTCKESVQIRGKWLQKTREFCYWTWPLEIHMGIHLEINIGIWRVLKCMISCKDIIGDQTIEICLNR